MPGIEVDNVAAPVRTACRARPASLRDLLLQRRRPLLLPDRACPTPHRELGAFAQTGAHEVESTYNFILLDAGAIGPTGDVTVDAFDPSAGATVINIIGYVDIHQDGDIDSHTNGFIIYTEKPRPGGPNRGDLRVGEIQSTNNDVTLNSPGRGPRRRQRHRR